MDIEKAKRDPSSIFATPEEVLHHPDLSKTEKVAILRNWAQEEQAKQTAEEENMPKKTGQSDSSERLRIINTILSQLE